MFMQGSVCVRTEDMCAYRCVSDMCVVRVGLCVHMGTCVHGEPCVLQLFLSEVGVIGATREDE